MNQRLSWSQIRDFFTGHWIELVDVEWGGRSAFPTRARVRNFAKERGELTKKIQKCSEDSDATVLYLGNVHSHIEYDPRISAL